MRTNVFWLLLLSFFQLLPGSALGQDPSQQDEVVRQLESRASRGGDDLGTSIRTLARIGAWQAVDRWLTKVDSFDTQPDLARTASLIGPDMLLRISLREELSKSGRSAINKMSTATKAEQESPARMQQSIALLGRGNVDEQLQAARVLRAGGNAAIKAIVDRIAKGTSAMNRTRLLKILDPMGPSGTQCLDQLALYGDETSRLNSLSALVEQNNSLATRLSAAFAFDATAREKTLAQASLVSDYPDVNAAQVIQFLTEQLSLATRLASTTPNDQTPATIWSIGADRSSVTSARSNNIYLKYRDAYDAARRLSRQKGISQEALRMAMIADLNYRVMVDVDWGDATQVNAFLSAYGNEVSVSGLSTALAEARRGSHAPAALGLIRVVDAMTVGSTSVKSLLSSDDGSPAPLVDAVHDPEPRIRFEAARVINSDSPTNFAGASDVRKTLAEMSRLPDRPTAILIETRPFIALSQESILGQLGFEVRTVETAMAAERAIAKGGDVGLVVSKIRLADMRPTELVDRVRRLPRGAGVGIVFYDDGDASERTVNLASLETTARRWKNTASPGVRVVPLPGDPTALSGVIRQMTLLKRLPSLTLADRRSYRNVGITALTK